jgi:hypothetical protein
MLTNNSEWLEVVTHCLDEATAQCCGRLNSGASDVTGKSLLQAQPALHRCINRMHLSCGQTANNISLAVRRQSDDAIYHQLGILAQAAAPSTSSVNRR